MYKRERLNFSFLIYHFPLLLLRPLLVSAVLPRCDGWDGVAIVEAVRGRRRGGHRTTEAAAQLKHLALQFLQFAELREYFDFSY